MQERDENRDPEFAFSAQPWRRLLTTLLQHGHVTFLPVVAGSMEFAAEVRRAILAARPETVAVPLWRDLQAEILGAVARLPELSAIAWSWSDPASDDEDGDSYWIVEPGDPYVEAIRTARETGAEVLFLLESVMDGSNGLNLFAAAPLPDSLSLIHIYRLRRAGLLVFFPLPVLIPARAGDRIAGAGPANRIA